MNRTPSSAKDALENLGGVDVVCVGPVFGEQAIAAFWKSRGRI